MRVVDSLRLTAPPPSPPWSPRRKSPAPAVWHRRGTNFVIRPTAPTSRPTLRRQPDLGPTHPVYPTGPMETPVATAAALSPDGLRQGSLQFSTSRQENVGRGQTRRPRTCACVAAQPAQIVLVLGEQLAIRRKPRAGLLGVIVERRPALDLGFGPLDQASAVRDRVLGLGDFVCSSHESATAPKSFGSSDRAAIVNRSATVRIRSGSTTTAPRLRRCSRGRGTLQDSVGSEPNHGGRIAG